MLRRGSGVFVGELGRKPSVQRTTPQGMEVGSGQSRPLWAEKQVEWLNVCGMVVWNCLRLPREKIT